MTTEKVNQRINEISEEKPNWDKKQVVIQAVGEIIEENDSFVDSFLLSESYGENVGVLWINKEIDYIPAKTLEILGKNGMNIRQNNYNRSRQIEFF